jgi:hypothetical protein
LILVPSPPFRPFSSRSDCISSSSSSRSSAILPPLKPPCYSSE